MRHTAGWFPCVSVAVEMRDETLMGFVTEAYPIVAVL